MGRGLLIILSAAIQKVKFFFHSSPSTDAQLRAMLVQLVGELKTNFSSPSVEQKRPRAATARRAMQNCSNCPYNQTHANSHKANYQTKLLVE